MQIYSFFLTTLLFQLVQSSKLYKLSYSVPISSTSNFLSQFTNCKESCTNEIDTTIETNILTFINHVILKTVSKEKIQDINSLVSAKELEGTQKYCLLQDTNVLCILSYTTNEISLSTSLKIKNENENMIISFDTELNSNKEVLISSAIVLDSIFQEYSVSYPIWTIPKESDDISYKDEVLSSPNQKKVLYKQDNIELWEVQEQKALFLNSNVRYLYTNAFPPPSRVHAESFVHPALLNHPYPTRVLILSKFPFLYIQEVLKYESIQTIDVLGTDINDLLNVIDILPQLNDCSGYVGINANCLENEIVSIIMDQDVNDWIDSMLNKEEDDDHAKYAKYPKYDVIYVDSPSSSSQEELYWLTVPFIQKITNLLDFNEHESMVVINSGHVPTTFDTLSKSQELRKELLIKGSSRKMNDIDYESIVLYDEPNAVPLNEVFIILFHKQKDSHVNYFRDRATAFDIDIITKFRKFDEANHRYPPTVWYDGPTQDRYKRPSRSWENWFCNTTPWSEYYLCTTFYTQFFNKKYHHFNTLVQDHAIKNRALYTTEPIPQGHFINADDDSTLLHVDSLAWRKLNKFIDVIPSAVMYKELKDFILAYGFQADFLGLSGWSVSLTSNQTFTNHACTLAENTVSACNKAFETDLMDGDDVIFNPALQRRASLFAVLTVATRDLERGEELMVDYSLFRDTVDEEYARFLVGMCEDGVGLVPNREEEEEILKKMH